MEIKLVYRGLRQISDWALRYYSDIYVDGEENVPADGPLILASCHHNEILDIATLSVTIPHGRPVCFWAKSTMFQNPLVGSVLRSSGSIPVTRNPNAATLPFEHSTGGANGGGAGIETSSANASLFKETFKALAKGDVIGVFPEGTSCTEPGTVQLRDGASRAALEYVKWTMENKGGQEKGLRIVPVGIVWTDKTRFQSKVCVRWGKSIDVEAFTQEHASKVVVGDGESEMWDAVKALTAEIEKELLSLTINAPDWDTLYVTNMARNILWANDDLPSSHFVWISQNLIDLFTDPNAAPSSAKAKEALLKYHSLLYHAGITHDALNALLPDANKQPNRLRALTIVIQQLFVTVLHPRFLLSFPVLALHIPAYAIGALAGRLLGKADEEETKAQFKTVFGGLAAAGAYAAVTRALVQGMVVRSVVAGSLPKLGEKLPRLLVPAAQFLCSQGHRLWSFIDKAGYSGKFKTAVGVFGVFYATSFVLSRWHNYWVGSNYTQFKKLLTSFRLFLGILAPKSSALTGAKLAPYTEPYIPPQNPYIKRRVESVPRPRPQSVASKKLVRPLLDARAEATRAMWIFMIDSKYLHGLVSARMRGEAWMQVGPAKRHTFKP